MAVDGMFVEEGAAAEGLGIKHNRTTQLLLQHSVITNHIQYLHK